MVPPLRAAVVGYGLAGSAFHAPVIAATPGIAVAAIVTGNSERAAAAGARYPDAEVLPHADALWAAADRFDVAILATPNRSHLPLGLAALRAGLHLVIDKPFAPSVDEARRLIRQARDGKRLLTVYHNRRWDGDFLTLRRLLQAGELGDVHRFESRFERWRPVPKAGWRQDPDPEEAGGILFDLGSHLIDQALLLFGPVRHLHAEIDTRRAGARVDDDVFLALTHESGVRSHLWMSALAADPAPRLRVLGSRGTWVKHGLDVQEAVLRAGGDPGEPGFGVEPRETWGVLHQGEDDRVTPAEPGDYPAFYRRLVRAVRGGAPPPVKPEEALAVIEVVEQARRYGLDHAARAGSAAVETDEVLPT